MLSDALEHKSILYIYIFGFLSWKMVKHRVNTALILEDDIHFEHYFVFQVQRLFEEAAKLLLDWDLM